jgi:hypothetical protein
MFVVLDFEVRVSGRFELSDRTAGMIASAR